MKPNDLKRMARRIASTRQASRQSDPQFYGALNVLPDPDPILRAMGRADETFNAIMSDAHVIGEVKTIRAGFLAYKRRVALQDGEWPDNSPERKAQQLCADLFKRKPNDIMTWDDLIWSMATAVLYGRRAHELVWDVKSSQLMPSSIFDVPNRRFVFDTDSKPRLLTKDNNHEGEPVEPYKYVFTRHMPSHDNPYGRAVLSSCFWPYTFKHGGFKFFYEFCERFGLPFAVGKYPQGTPIEDQQVLVDALVNMIDEGVAGIPMGDEVDLLEAKTSGGLPQEALIALCNKEISKALTSQTLATDIDGTGSRAASETHKERSDDVNEADRNMVVATVNEIFLLITRYNFGEGVTPPVLEFHKDKKPTKDRADIYEIASRIGKPSAKAFHDEMNIPMAESDDDLLRAAETTQTPIDQANFSESSCPKCNDRIEFNSGESLSETAANAADNTIESAMIEPVKRMLDEYENQGKNLKEFMEDLPTLFTDMDFTTLEQVTQQVLQFAFAEGLTGEV